MRIEQLSAHDAGAVERWEAFVATCPQATFFHRAGWQRVISDVFGHATYFLQAVRDDGSLAGVLPLACIRSRLFGKSLVGLPFASYGGAAADDDATRRCLEDEASRLAAQLDVDHLELRNLQPRDGWPTQDLYVAFKMPIPSVLDDRMLAIPQKRRNLVRKAIKLGLRAVPDDTVDAFFPVFAVNARDHGTPALPKKYFEALVATFGADCRILSVADGNGRRMSSIMCFFFRGEVMAYYAGEVPEARRMAANDLKYWEVMKWASASGCTVFDIGRSKKGTGSFDFKTLWGFEAHPLHYQYVLLRGQDMPQNNPSNPKYRLLIAAWQRLPLPVANIIGPWLVRSLG